MLFQLPAVRSLQTSAVSRDIDSAAKFIGAGAATVGVAGSGIFYPDFHFLFSNKIWHEILKLSVVIGIFCPVRINVLVWLLNK